MHFAGLGIATPGKRYLQSDCWAALRESSQFARLAPRSQALCRRVFSGTNGIASRHLALDRLEDALDIRRDVLHARFVQHAPELAGRAAAEALADAAMDAGSIDALIISTCTGYLCPGLTSYVSERLGMRKDAILLDLVGQGCGAALPNLRTASALIGQEPGMRVLSVCVEVCSAAMYLDDDPGVLISACLFGDGAAAAVLVGEPLPGRRRVKWVRGFSLIDPLERECLRFETRDGLLRNRLGSEVPKLAALRAEEVLRTALAETGVRREEICCWVLHAGGRDVLASLRSRLELSEGDVAVSADTLREYGNLSSPFVLFVLRESLKRLAPGGRWWLASFGAGFSSHGAFLEVE